MSQLSDQIYVTRCYVSCRTVSAIWQTIQVQQKREELSTLNNTKVDLPLGWGCLDGWGWPVMYPRVLPAMWPKCPGWGMYPEGPSWGFPGVPDEVWGAWEEAGWWKGGSTFHLATCLPFSCRMAGSWWWELTVKDKEQIMLSRALIKIACGWSFYDIPSLTHAEKAKSAVKLIFYICSRD